jgi:hypothetical protein
MQLVRRTLLVLGLLGLPAGVLGAPAKTVPPPVTASIDTTLSTASGHIRQLAFDGDDATFFVSAQNAGPNDHFTLRLDKPVAVQSIAVATGRPKGGDQLDKGSLEVSSDGKKFEPLAMFADGQARAKLANRKIQAVRIQPAEDLKHPLAIREITITSDPPMVLFKYPVEFTVQVDDAPEMKAWAEKVARICERAYPMINEELKSEGFKPATQVTLTLKRDYGGVAYCSGNQITGSVKFFKAHPDDVGAMVHETVHVVQRYRGPNRPTWLVEGVADYIRFFKYEPGKLGRINASRAHYNGSYRVTAAFLAYVTEKHDKEVVRKVNKALREGQYKDEIFKTLTGKTVQELDEEWRATLRRGRPQ